MNKTTSTWVSRFVRTRVFILGSVCTFAASIVAFLAESWQADNAIEGVGKCPLNGSGEIRHSTAAWIETTFAPPRIVCFQDGYPPVHQSTLISSTAYYLTFVLLAAALVIFVVKMAHFFGWFSKKPIPEHTYPG